MPPKDPRQYVWTIDTIAYPGSFQTNMSDIWGSSPSNVFIVGHNDQGLGLMWRFDGTKWANVKLVASEGGNITEAINLSAVFGSGPNDIWAVGMTLDINPHPPPFFADSSLIIHFDGIQWREQKIQRGGALWSISGCDPQEMWASGSEGTIYHYNGTSWARDSSPIPIISSARQELGDIRVKNRAEAYVLGSNTPISGDTSFGNLATFYFLSKANQQWSIAGSYSFHSGQTGDRFGLYGLWLSPNGALYSFDSGVFRWTGSGWINVYQTSSALRRIAGVDDNNFFVVGDFGKVIHYNGVDWYEFFSLKNQNVVYSSAWTDGREVFVVGYLNNGSKTILLHGK